MVSGRKVDALLAMNERARTPCRENFEQHRVRDAPVEDDRGLDPRVDRAEAGIDLGNHAAGDRRVGLQRVDAGSVEVGEPDRKGVGWGKGGSVGVELGGSDIIKKKKRS